MNFLVTGGAGFIGSHVCERLLQAGHAGWVLDDLNPFYDPAIKRGNLREMQAAHPGVRAVTIRIPDVGTLRR